MLCASVCFVRNICFIFYSICQTIYLVLVPGFKLDNNLEKIKKLVPPEFEHVTSSFSAHGANRWATEFNY